MKTKSVLLATIFTFVVVGMPLQAMDGEDALERGHRDGYKQAISAGYERGYSGNPDTTPPDIKTLADDAKYQQAFQGGVYDGFMAGYVKGIEDRRKDERRIEYKKGYDAGYKDGSSGVCYSLPTNDALGESILVGYHEGYYDGVRDKAQ